MHWKPLTFRVFHAGAALVLEDFACPVPASREYTSLQKDIQGVVAYVIVRLGFMIYDSYDSTQLPEFLINLNDFGKPWERGMTGRRFVVWAWRHGGQRARATGTGMRGRGSLQLWMCELTCCLVVQVHDNIWQLPRKMAKRWGRVTRMSFLCSDEMQVLFIGRELGKVCRQVDMATSMCTWLSSIISITVQCSTVGSWYFAANL